MTDGPTDRPRYSVHRNRLHLPSSAMWPNKLYTSLQVKISVLLNAFMLLVGRQEGHLACNKYGGMVKVGTG